MPEAQADEGPSSLLHAGWTQQQWNPPFPSHSTPSKMLRGESDQRSRSSAQRLGGQPGEREKAQPSTGGHGPRAPAEPAV